MVNRKSSNRKSKKLFFACALAALAIAGCQPEQKTGSCHVYGSVADSTMEGRKIVVEPLDMTKTTVKSDTVEIKGGKFEVALDSVLIYKVMPADGALYSVLQPIIIVGEPGSVWVRLGIDSHSGGTAQNDTLEQWKILAEAHTHVYNQLRAQASMASQKGDTVQAGRLNREADSLHRQFGEATHHMADGVGQGALYEFLSRYFR